MRTAAHAARYEWSKPVEAIVAACDAAHSLQGVPCRIACHAAASCGCACLSHPGPGSCRHETLLQAACCDSMAPPPCTYLLGVCCVPATPCHSLLLAAAASATLPCTAWCTSWTACSHTRVGSDGPGVAERCSSVSSGLLLMLAVACNGRCCWSCCGASSMSTGLWAPSGASSCR